MLALWKLIVIAVVTLITASVSTGMLSDFAGLQDVVPVSAGISIFPLCFFPPDYLGGGNGFCAIGFGGGGSGWGGSESQPLMFDYSAFLDEQGLAAAAN